MTEPSQSVLTLCEVEVMALPVPLPAQTTSSPLVCAALCLAEPQCMGYKTEATRVSQPTYLCNLVVSEEVEDFTTAQNISIKHYQFRPNFRGNNIVFMKQQIGG